MRDRHGNPLSPGDPVTVCTPQDRPRYHRGKQGIVQSLGRIRVKVKFESKILADGIGPTETFLPEDLELGHEEQPSLQDLVLMARRQYVTQAAELAAEAGIITEAQRHQLVELWRTYTATHP
ncbi:hypothetical protein [Streptomyces mobaraensis]|uniref:hypothetical protein n=1 Tax=Streptomyces mobaraensis TaxID=35621 RepID=UPI0033F0020E